MTKKRSRLEMYLDVLEMIDSGINKPTNIMYKCNLSWIPMQQILNSMIEKGLIRIIEKGSKNAYEITDKGRDLLRYLGTILDVLTTQKSRAFLVKDTRTKPTILTRLRRDLLSNSQQESRVDTNILESQDHS